MMKHKFDQLFKTSWSLLGVFLIALSSGCATEPGSEAGQTLSSVQKVQPGQQYATFLTDYSKLRIHDGFDGEVLAYVSDDVEANLRGYVAMVVDPVQVYLKSDAEVALIPEGGPEAVASYFEYALLEAVSDAFPVVENAGPLVLRLRAAIVGVDVGGEVAGEISEPLARAIDIGEVGVEFELVDSETGNVIAAMVDQTNLGNGAEIGTHRFSRTERFAAAKEAFDEWAMRLRLFLDLEHELSEEDAALLEYSPY